MIYNYYGTCQILQNRLLVTIALVIYSRVFEIKFTCSCLRLSTCQGTQIQMFIAIQYLISLIFEMRLFSDVTCEVSITKGPSINYVSRRGGGGLAKCLCYYISLCSKAAFGGGRGGQKLAKSCQQFMDGPLSSI